MKTQIKASYRDIAKLFAKHLPIEGKEFGDKVGEFLTTISRMQPEAKTALKASYVFASKVPRGEQDDLFQELVLAILERRTKDEKLAYAIARFDWVDWWRKYTVRQHFFAGSLNQVYEDTEGNECQLGELLVGECEFERKMDGKLDAQSIWNQLPDSIKPIVQKRLEGKPLTNTERQRLNYHVKQKPMVLVS